MERYKKLSNREREVLQMIAEGHSSRQVAEILCISISTVKSHRRSIMEKLDIDTVEKLILFTIQIGLVDPGI
jgi:DNA-binding CsgD family transcriptional regulator